jgi:hypothetical protein
MSIETDKLYKYIGLGVVGIVLLYIILRTLKFQLNIVEGLTTMSSPTSAPVGSNTDVINTPIAIDNNSTMVEDTLLINKYQKSYEDTIIALDKSVDFSILQTILKNAESISVNPTSNDSMQTITMVNNLKQFKDSLNEAMTFMNSIASSSSSN